MNNDLIVNEDTKEVLMAMAAILRKNCLSHKRCKTCPLYDRHMPYAGNCCPISVGDNPEDWPVN